MLLRKNKIMLIIVPRWRGKYFGHVKISKGGGQKVD
jgi:hypothetical protein